MGNSTEKTSIKSNTFHFKETKKIDGKAEGIMSLVLLNDNKIAFCSDIGTLSLLDPFNDYHYSI